MRRYVISIEFNTLRGTYALLNTFLPDGTETHRATKEGLLGGTMIMQTFNEERAIEMERVVAAYVVTNNVSHRYDDLRPLERLVRMFATDDDRVITQESPEERLKMNTDWEPSDEAIAEIVRDLQIERELDRDNPFDDEPLQSDLHDEMREAAHCSLLPEEVRAIVMCNATGGTYSDEETAQLLEGLYADDSNIRDFSAND